MPVNPNREYRTVATPFEVRKCKDDEEKNYIVEGYATTFDEPYVLFSDGEKDYFEKVDARALDETDMSDVIFQYDHSGMVYARKKNGTLDLSIDGHGLKVVADLGLTEDSRKLYDAIDKGLISEMSFAFTVDEDEYDKSSRTRTITRIKKLYDVSAVSIPANPGTDISAKRFIDGVIEEERQEMLKAEKIERKKQIIRILTEVL